MNANGGFQFSATLLSGQGHTVTRAAQAAGQSCSVGDCSTTSSPTSNIISGISGGVQCWGSNVGGQLSLPLPYLSRVPELPVHYP